MREKICQYFVFLPLRTKMALAFGVIKFLFQREKTILFHGNYNQF